MNKQTDQDLQNIRILTGNLFAFEPAVTGHVKTTSQMPVPDLPGHKKKHVKTIAFPTLPEDFWFSYCPIVIEDK